MYLREDFEWNVSYLTILVYDRFDNNYIYEKWVCVVFYIFFVIFSSLASKYYFVSI